MGVQSQNLLLAVLTLYRGGDKSLARPGRKQARKHVRDARDCNDIETRAVIKFFFLQGKAPNKIHALLTETLACFLPARAKDLPAPLYRVLLLLYISQGLPLLMPGSLQYITLTLCLHVVTVTSIIC